MYTGNRKKNKKKHVLNCINYYILPIGIFSGTDMIKIWNWFKAIGSFVRKIKEKKHKCRIVRVPKCLTQVPKCPGAELSRCRSV